LSPSNNNNNSAWINSGGRWVKQESVEGDHSRNAAGHGYINPPVVLKPSEKVSNESNNVSNYSPKVSGVEDQYYLGKINQLVDQINDVKLSSNSESYKERRLVELRQEIDSLFKKIGSKDVKRRFLLESISLLDSQLLSGDLSEIQKKEIHNKLETLNVTLMSL
jgi:hypothetical protein